MKNIFGRAALAVLAPVSITLAGCGEHRDSEYVKVVSGGMTAICKDGHAEAIAVYADGKFEKTEITEILQTYYLAGTQGFGMLDTNTQSLSLIDIPEKGMTLTTAGNLSNVKDDNFVYNYPPTPSSNDASGANPLLVRQYQLMNKAEDVCALLKDSEEGLKKAGYSISPTNDGLGLDVVVPNFETQQQALRAKATLQNMVKKPQAPVNAPG